MPVVSVLLPVYNTDPAHLRQAIDSVLAQSFADFEVLVANDASTDPRVEETVLSYADPRIHYMRHEVNGGISKTRNRLVEMARGKYLAVMDHDDTILPQRFEKQVALMESDPSIGVCGTAHKRFGKRFKNDVIRYPERDEDIRAELFFKCVIHHPSAMIRKQVLMDHAIRYDESLVSGNDRVLYRDISEHATLRNLSDVLCHYRLHPGMTSRTKRDAIVQEQKKIRESFLAKMQVTLSPQQMAVLNDFVLRGRCRIKTREQLQAVESVLSELARANARSGYLPVRAFDKLCAKYLVKRCVNAAIYGRVPSGEVLKNTALPVGDVKIPAGLKLFNNVMRG